MLKNIVSDFTLISIKIIAQNETKGSILGNLLRVLLILVILFILASIILPNIMSCRVPITRRNEWRIWIRTLNRAQEAYFLKNQRFASNFEELGFRKGNLRYYDLKILKNGIAFAKEIDNHGNVTRDYIGGVSYDLHTKTFSSILCQANESSNYSISNPSKAIINAGKVHHSQIKCGVDVEEVN